MTTPSGQDRHIVRRQVIDVELRGSESDGLAVQRRLSVLCREVLAGVIERVLDRCAPADGHLYIEHLEVDLGSVTLDELEDDLSDRMMTQLERSIRDQAQRATIATLPLPGDVQRKSDQEALTDALIYFLRTGILPWSFHLPPGRSFEEVLLDFWQQRGASNALPDSDRIRLRGTLALPAARERLVLQFSTAFLALLLRSLSPSLETTLHAALDALARADPMPAITRFVYQLWQTAFASASAGESPSGDTLVSAAWQELKAIADRSELRPMLEELWPGLITVLDQAQTSRTPEADAISPSPLAPRISADRAVPTVQGPSSELTELVGEGTFVENAGLALLHPFLPHLFEVLEIAVGDVIIQPERALSILHYLVTGQSVAPEYALMLPKVLCNLRLETPVRADIGLTAAEMAEANKLLDAVIGHWGALRNASPDALRGTFLLRPGKLSRDDDGDWLLQVEPQGFDILLDQLPWGISMIKLPWMVNVLRVEWR